MNITFLGGGNMASALIGGLLNQGFPAGQLTVIEISAEGRARLEEKFAVRCYDTPQADALDCDVLLLAVKPQQMRAACAPLMGHLDQQLLISIAAGLRMADLGRWLGAAGRPYARLVRVMPNTPALIGAGVNVGAGTITCNYDGVNKSTTTIEDGAFIGSNSSLVAPVTVAAGATIAAGSVITKDAPAGKLTVARARQMTVDGWQRPVKKPK